MIIQWLWSCLRIKKEQKKEVSSLDQHQHYCLCRSCASWQLWHVFSKMEKNANFEENCIYAFNWRKESESETSFPSLSPTYHLIFCKSKLMAQRLPPTPRCSSGANAGGRVFCHELDIGWVHIGQWIFSILAISDGLFWRKSVFCVFTL